MGQKSFKKKKKNVKIKIRLNQYSRFHFSLRGEKKRHDSECNVCSVYKYHYFHCHNLYNLSQLATRDRQRGGNRKEKKNFKQEFISLLEHVEVKQTVANKSHDYNTATGSSAPRPAFFVLYVRVCTCECILKSTVGILGMNG